MAEAIFGLIGVLVGGVLNFIAVSYLQRRNDRSALRSIARLAYDDCLHFQSTIVRALAGGRWWQPDELTPFQVLGKKRQFLFGALQDGQAPSAGVRAGTTQACDSNLLQLGTAALSTASAAGGTILGLFATPDGKPAAAPTAGK